MKWKLQNEPKIAPGRQAIHILEFMGPWVLEFLFEFYQTNPNGCMVMKKPNEPNLNRSLIFSSAHLSPVRLSRLRGRVDNFRCSTAAPGCEIVNRK